jgi:ABC-2 type transport system permease protein
MFAIASFEFRSRLKLISTWVYFLVFFALAMLWIAAAGGLFKEANISFGSGKVFVNSPYAVTQTVSVLGMFGITIMAAIMGRAVQQDFEYRTHNFFFTSPIQKLQYLGGRFAGALGVVVVVFTSIALGAFLATLLPGMDPERLGGNHWSTYLAPYGVMLLPNALLIGGIFFSLAALTRKMLPVYIGSVLMLIGQMIASQLVRDIDNKTLAALVDPFGSRALSILAEYWTVAERNTRTVPLEGVLLWNRLLWVAIGAGVAAVCAWRFSFAAFVSEGGGKKAGKESNKGRSASTGSLDANSNTVHPEVSKGHPAGETQGFDTSARTARGGTGTRVGSARPFDTSGRTAGVATGLRTLAPLTWLYFRETVKNIYFSVIVLAGILFLVFASTTVGAIFGTSTWPHTFQMLGLLSGSFSLFMLVIIAFYGGELVWRERDARLDQISDALPMPTWLPMLAKLFALMLVPLLLQVVLMMCGMAIQLAQGFTRFEIPLYLEGLGMDLLGYWLLCALAITIHSLVNNKYLGHFAMIMYYVVIVFASLLGLEHNLYKFGSTTQPIYSDMNGWGHFLPRFFAFQAYWTACSVVLLVLAYLFWPRGTASGWRERRRVASQRINARTLSVAGAGLVAFVALGGYIFYNTNVLNRYQSANDRLEAQADYEKKYKALMSAEPQPKITGVKVDVALYPREQNVRVKGSFELQNKNTVPVTTLNLHMFLADAIDVHQLDIGVPAQLVEDDKRPGVRRYKLAQPLAPGASTTLRFDVEGRIRGFMNEGSNTAVVGNGSFLNANFIEPLIGYQERMELERDQDRRKFGLKPKERMPDRDDPKGLLRSPLSPDADWVSFDATLSTEPDQIAIAPGYLQRDWTENGRRYFHYQMDAPIQNFYAFQSARYAVKRDQWNGVAIELYYQPGHEYNLPAMIQATKDSLDYDSRNFGPYQYRQFRITEFPRYEVFAQSFPNTIPYSEAIGFIARVRPDDEKDIDYPYYVTSHEMAHQWWGHQVAGADVQGGTMLIESMAQYSALMVLKHRIGPAKMRKFLRYELERYLTGRGFEQKKELPLARVENQPYIHYSKGSLVMYALADYIGEDKLNQAIRKFRDANAFKGPPYPNTTQFLAAVREVTPPEMQYVIDDMFERIVVYDNRALSATAKKRADGRYDVTVSVSANKLIADELGKETPAKLADLIDIGVLDAKGEPLALERRRIDTETSSVSFVVDKTPATAGIDPLNKLIDRKPKDNVVPVTIGPQLE